MTAFHRRLAGALRFAADHIGRSHVMVEIADQRTPVFVGTFAAGGVVPQGGPGVVHVPAGEALWPAGRLSTPEIRTR